jgi:O-antigen/teichoic acid export membrane protein
MSFLRKGVLVSGGQVLGGVLNLIAGIIFARALGPSGTGQIEVFRSADTIFMMFLGLGIGNANIYFLNNRMVNPIHVITNSLKVSIGLSLILITSFTWAIHAFQGYFGKISYLTAIWFSIGCACGLGTNTLNAFLTSRLDAKKMVTIYVAPRVILLVFVILLVVLDLMNVESILAVIALGYAGTYAILLFFLRKYISLKQSFDWELISSILRYGMKFLFASILIILAANIPVILLRYFNQTDFSAIGLYSRAVGISGMVSMVPVAIGPMYYAKWAEVKGLDRVRQVEMALRFNLAFGIISCISLLIMGRFLIKLLYGEAFIDAYQALEILAPSFIFMTVLSVFQNMFNGDGKALNNVFISLTNLIVVAVVTWFTVRKLGIQGPAYGVLSGYVLVTLFCVFISVKYYGLRLREIIMFKIDDFRYITNSLIIPFRNFKASKIFGF